MKHVRWIGLLLLAMRCSAALGDTGEPLQRWAVLCSRELQETALGDLLAVELSKATGLELVNREELSRIGSELALAQLFDAPNVGVRLKVGRMLRADALVLVRRNDACPNTPLLLMIAECKQGARLHSQELSAKFDAGAAAVAAAASQIAKIVLATRRRFPHGVTRLLGVPDFLSRNLTHDYDQFQGRYAELLRAAISIDEGVAVLEIEEARSIRKELAGGELGVRHVPLIVEGEFHMDGLPGSARPTVDLRVRLDSDESSQTIESPKLAIAESSKWIVSTLARQVLDRSGNRNSLSTRAQVSLLVARADEFTQIGDFQQAVNLREAALLVEPSLVEQRLKLLDEYRAVINCRVGLAADEEYPGCPAIRETFGRKVDVYLQALECLEYVIRNKLVDRRRAVELSGVLPRCLHDGLPRTILRIGEHRYYRVGQEELARAQKPTRRFFLEVVPRILDLPGRAGDARDASAECCFLKDWQRLILEGVAYRTDVPYLLPKDLADLTRAYTQIVPDGVVPYSLRLPEPAFEPGPRAATDEEFQEFYRTLAASNRKTASLSGRYALLRHEFRTNVMTPERGQMLLDKLRGLQRDSQALPRPPDAPPAGAPMVWNELAGFERDIENALHPERRQTMAANDPTTQVKRSTGAVRFTPITLAVKLLDGTVETHPQPKQFSGTAQHITGMNVVRCGQATDVFWHHQGLCVMRQPGSIDEVLHTEASDFRHDIQQVVWDGRQLWVAKADGAVWIVAADGDVRAKVDASCGLPPASRGAVLCPVESGRVVALGSLGDPPRAWAATIVYVDGKATVRVFFEATRAPSPEPRLDGRAAIDIGFGVGAGSVHAYQPKGMPRRPLLLVQRAFAFPLQVDLETLAVSILPFDGEKYLPHEKWWYSRDGVLLGGASARIGIRAPQGQPWPDGNFWRPIPLNNPPAPNPDYDDTRSPEMVGVLFDGGRSPAVIDSEDGYVYYFGQFCYRINPATWTADRLTSTWMPWPYDDCRGFGVSAHYGLTTWAAGTLYRITIDEASIPPAGGPILK